MFERLDALEAPVCFRLVQACQTPFIKQGFVFFSWLGNGPAWGVLLAYVLLNHDAQFGWSLTSVIAINALIYRYLKRYTVRRRPFVYRDDITQGTRALDEFSFPSGHTLHAVGILVVLFAFAPWAALSLLPIVLLIMVSRVVLGLHYPSDVFVGAVLGIAVANSILGFG